MAAVVFYVLKVIVCSAIFAAYYWCFLRNGRFYGWNRFYLLASSVLSLIIPLVTIPVTVVVAQAPTEALTGIAVAGEPNVMQLLNQQFAPTITTAQILAVVYMLLVIVLLCTGVVALMRIWKLKKQALVVEVQHVKLYSTNDAAAPFTFFSSIFWRNGIEITSPEGQSILQHELVHARAGHSYDKVFMQLLCTVLWINPVFWLIKRELALVHEFAADSASIKDNDTERLSALILCSLYPNHYIEFTNQFFKSPIKRRLIMLSKNTTVKFNVLRQFMAIPLAIATLCIFAIKLDAKPMPVPTPIPQKPKTDTVANNVKTDVDKGKTNASGKVNTYRTMVFTNPDSRTNKYDVLVMLVGKSKQKFKIVEITDSNGIKVLESNSLTNSYMTKGKPLDAGVYDLVIEIINDDGTVKETINESITIDTYSKPSQIR